ncbi:MAG: glycine C-acetyltransferase, partial [Gammaproteobacteria bacterium]
MSFKSAKASLAQELVEIKEAGLWKTERIIASEQKNDITLADGSEVINMCANNYLGLANNPEVIQAAKDSYDQ